MQRFSLFLASFLLFAGIANAVQFPEFNGFVNDYAGVLTSEQAQSLEIVLSRFKAETSNELALVIVNNFQGLDAFTYSQELFMKWGLGDRIKNNGLLFLIGPREGLPFPERGEMFVNVGRGLEGALPDALASKIANQEAIPFFKEKKFYEGISIAVNSIMQATKGEYQGTGDDGYSSASDGAWLEVVFWIILFMLSYVVSFLARTKSWWLGGLIGAVGGGLFGYIFMTGFNIFLATVIFGSAGLLFDYFVSKNYQKRLKEGKPTDFWHSGGGFWSGGGGSSFGGFGGGISGGGGAGGRW